ncbi:MAG: hypothetical protein ABW137_30000 [Mycobacterium sp.]
MNIKNPLTIAVLVAAAVAAAPVAVAQAAPNCGGTGPGTECVTPGNAELNDALPPTFLPQYPEFSLFGFGRGHGGFHR